jgi:hypothetical protein
MDWERLERGDYNWSHVAKRYWPERVREKCRANKSFAIAHGHEEWYQGAQSTKFPAIDDTVVL